MDREVAKSLGDLEQKLQELERELTSLGAARSVPGSDPDGGAQVADPAIAGDDTGTEHPASHGIPGRLVDEAVEHAQTPSGDDEAVADPVRDTAADTAFGAPAVWGGEELPARPGADALDWREDVRETAYGEIPTEPSIGAEAGTDEPPAASATNDAPPPAAPGPAVYPPPPAAFPSAPPAFPPPPATTSSWPGLHDSPHSSSAPPLPTTEPVHPPIPPAEPAQPSLDLAELERFEQKLRDTMYELLDEYGRLLSRAPRT